MIFYLGAHHDAWLKRVGVPLFVSDRVLRARRSLPVAVGSWGLDSGGFTELSMHGEWRTTPHAYAARTRRYADEIGGLDFASQQDWMCEPFMLEKTRRTIAEHQRLTVRNFLDLSTLWPDGPFIPVLQGWEEADYMRHVDQFAAAGVDLTTAPRVGIGSVCRRQGTAEAERIVRAVASLGIRLHAFGVKAAGLARFASVIASADSMAWSFSGRQVRPCPRRPEIASCANCLHHALDWRSRLLSRPEQLVMTECAD